MDRWLGISWLALTTQLSFYSQHYLGAHRCVHLQVKIDASSSLHCNKVEIISLC